MKNRFSTSAAFSSLDDCSIWKKRAEEIRESEWTLYRESLEVVHQALDRIRARPFDPITVRDLVKLIEITFTVGRRATGLPLDGSGYPSSSDSDSAWMRHVEQELDRVYGPSNDRSPTSPPPDTVTPEALRAEPRSKTESNSGHFSRHQSENPNPPSADAVHDDSQAPPPLTFPPTHLPSRNQPPPQLPTEIARTEPPQTNVAATLPSLPTKPTEAPPAETPPKEVPTDAASAQPAEAEAQRPKKHKPYWLNGHYYPNPEFPEAVARAMVANAQRSRNSSCNHTRTFKGP